MILLIAMFLQLSQFSLWHVIQDICFAQNFSNQDSFSILLNTRYVGMGSGNCDEVIGFMHEGTGGGFSWR